MEEKKVSEYITQTEAYQFGKKNAIRLVQSKQQLNVALGARYLLDIYKYSYLEIAQFILDSYDIVSLEDVLNKLKGSEELEKIDIVLPNSILAIGECILNGLTDVEDQVDCLLKIDDKYKTHVNLLLYQNITFYALIEDELHKYLKKSLL